MEDTAKYKIGEYEFVQSFPTISDIKKFVTILEGFNVAELSAGSLLKSLLEKNLLNDFINTILKGPVKINADDLEIDLVVEVISDFLSSARFSKMLSAIFLIVENLTNQVGKVSQIGQNSTGTI